MRALPRPLRYLLLAAGFSALAMAGAVTGGAADAHHLPGLSHLAVIVVGIALPLAVFKFRMAYITGIRDPALARQWTAMVQAMDAGQAVSGTFWAGLRDVVPGSPLTRWKRGRVAISPQSVTWVRAITGRARDLTGAECTGGRLFDRGYKDMTLTPPSYYDGEVPAVITLHANGSDVEVAASAQLLDVLRHSLARTQPRPHGS